MISTNRLDAKATSMPDKFARSTFSKSALLMLPVEINNSGGSSVIKKKLKGARLTLKQIKGVVFELKGPGSH